MTYDRSAITADYDRKWRAMEIQRPAAVDAAARRILKNWGAYKAVEAETGVPAHFIGVLHMRECNNDMRGCLHNGELIIGTQRKTRLVPRGRGPFATWHEAAVDALAIKGYSAVRKWTPGVCCYEAERFNGWGYRNKGIPSPYVLGATQFYVRGKYVRDHVFDARKVDPQLGVAPVMKRCIELAGEATRPTVFKRLSEKRAETKEIVREDRRLTWGARYNSFCEFLGLTWAAILAFVEQSAAFLTDWRVLSVLGVLASAYVASQFFKWKAVTAAKRARLVIPATDKPKATNKRKVA